MRLFIVGPRWVGGWTEGLGRAADALGHKVALFFYLDGDSNYLKDEAKKRLPPILQKGLRVGLNQVKRAQIVLMNRRLIAAARAFQPDAIVILRGETISWESLVTLRTLRIPLVSWWVDDPFRFPSFLRHFELFDIVYAFDKECVANLKERGFKHVMYLPCACDQTTFYPQSLNPSDYPLLNCTVGFVAVYYPERAVLLSQMKGLDLGLWGSGWEAAPELCEFPSGTWRGLRITAANAAKVYNLVKICPNVHHSQTRFGGINTRTFEILAAGGFELVDNVPGLEEHFEVGREIVAYSSPGELRELTEYYLSHPSGRAAIIERGRSRVLRDHTYEKRLEVILKTLDGSALS
ncbi:MAG: glycosyltransferase [Desulfobaccales bacterium]